MTSRQTTEDLIRALASTPAPAPFSPGLVLGGVLLGLLAVLVAYLYGFGLRPDLAVAWDDVPMLAKTGLPIGLSIVAMGLALHSSRPEARLTLWPLVPPLGLAVALVLYRLSVAEGSVLAEAMGQTALACFGSILALSVLPLGAGVVLLRRAAPMQPALTGGLLGLGAAAGVASGYALHCTEDSPLFFVPWYGLAICLVGALGAWLGLRFLRW